MPGVRATMDEWKAGTLRSGSKHGPVVQNQKQAIAIALSEEGKQTKKRRTQAARDEAEFQTLRRAAMGKRAG